MQTPLDVPPFNELLQCYAVGVAYDFIEKTGQLYIEDGGCCDMSGCIEMFTRIDSGAVLIETFSGGIRDTSYRKTRNEWIALIPSEVK